MANWLDNLQKFKSETLGDDTPPPDTTEADLWNAVVAGNPLQTLIHAPCDSTDKHKLEQQRKEALFQTKTVEHSCDSLYAALSQRVEVLADETVTATFPWRVRAGGLLGFQEMLLPVFHPTYGIPYVPSSSLKGMVRSWAWHAMPDERADIDRLLGHLKKGGGGSNGGNSGSARLAAVQFLDAFPTQRCLSVDIATPQWKWQSNAQIKYGPEPHPMLSMENVTLTIGLKATSLGTAADVAAVREWLDKALLSEGLGGRISAGYGRTEQAVKAGPTTTNQYVASQHAFELWSEGIHGIDPKSPEFRPVAVRGVLRYWFRALSLGLYSPEQCRMLESELFGAIEPTAQVGSLRISAVLDDTRAEYNKPFMAAGYIRLEAKTAKHLALAQNLLKLACHLGGIGRGARRPLHWNTDRLRGCYWALTEVGDQLGCDKALWKGFFQSLKQSFSEVKAPGRPVTMKPGRPKQRTQGVLDSAARIYLVPSSKLMHPRQVSNWRNEGNRPKVRGAALEFFYGSGYKGVNRQGEGNNEVGGDLGTPSFVWLAANKLHSPDEAYQVMTVFDITQRDRAAFHALLKSHKGAVQVWPYDNR